MLTPIFGGFEVSRSTNLADAQIINLFPHTVDTKQGKQIGALYATPGLDLLATVGLGPIRAQEKFSGADILVSGFEVYSVNSVFAATLLGTIGTQFNPVSMINNGKQLALFDGVNGYLVPGGYPLTGGTIGSGGANYAVGDLIYLQASDGTQNATAVLQVATLGGGGAVSTFTVAQTGAFNAKATGFTQQSTDGSGTGFTLTLPTYGALMGLYTMTLPFSGPVLASYQDGFGLLGEIASQEFFQSNLFDLSIWQPLNFSSADAQPDSIVGIAALHEEQFIFKQADTEVWINAGLPGFAFQRLAGVHIEMGCAAPFSIAKAGESLCWVSQNEEGFGQVHQITGYEPRKISTKAIDSEIQKYPAIYDAIAYAYQQDGHLFYVVTFPSAYNSMGATWVCDLSMNPPAWHRRGAFSNGQFSRHWSNSYLLFQGKCIVGDYRNGNLYAFNPNTKTDNGAPQRWVRSWRALPKPVFDPVTFSSLQIDMETGIGVTDGTNPQVVLRWSDDGGHRWSNDRFVSAGKVGETGLRIKYNRLGSTRLNSGLDRIFEISSSDQFFTAIVGANLE